MHTYPRNVLLAAAFVVAARPHAQTLTPILLFGEQVSGTGGAEVDVVSRIQVNAAGDVAAFVGLSGGTPGVTGQNDFALVLQRGGPLEVVLREGDTVPGSGGEIFDPESLLPQTVADHGLARGVLPDDRLIFWSNAVAPAAPDEPQQRLYMFSDSGLELLTNARDPWRDTPGYDIPYFWWAEAYSRAPEAVRFQMYALASSNSQELVGTFAISQPGMPAVPEPQILWESKSGMLFRPRVTPETPMPSAPMPDVVSGTYPYAPPAVTFANDNAVFWLDQGTYREIMREGQPALGVPGTTYDSFTVVSGEAEALVIGTVRTATRDKREVIWRVADGVASILLSPGEPSDFLDGRTVGYVTDLRATPGGARLVNVSECHPFVDCPDALAAALLVRTDGTITELPLYDRPLPGSGGFQPSFFRQSEELDDIETSPETEDFYITYNQLDQFGCPYRTLVYRYDSQSNSFVPFALEQVPFDFSAAQDGSDMQTLERAGRPMMQQGRVYISLGSDDSPLRGVFEYTPNAGQCPADTNGDGLVTPADFSAWITAFNTQSPACDQNADGLCTPADFSAWILNFNTGCP